MVKDDSKKNPSFIAFFKLLLGRVKAEIMLISWHFFMAFCIHPPLPFPSAHSLPPSFWCKWEVFRWYISRPSFIYMGYVILEFWYLICSFSSKKVLFQAASGWLFEHNPPNSGLIGFKFPPVIKCNLIHQIMEGFYNILNKWSKLGQKTDFLGNF